MTSERAFLAAIFVILAFSSVVLGLSFVEEYKLFHPARIEETHH